MTFDMSVRARACGAPVTTKRTRRESLIVRPLCQVLLRELYSRCRIRECQISFAQIIALIESRKLIQVLEHPNAEGYPNQLL